MAFQKTPGSQCSTCFSYLDSVQRECCINSCLPFPDRVFTKSQAKCNCIVQVKFSMKTLTMEPVKNNKNCCHTRASASLPEILEFGINGKGTTGVIESVLRNSVTIISSRTNCDK